MDEQLISDCELDVLLKDRDPLNMDRWRPDQLEPALARLAEDISAAPGRRWAPTPRRRGRRRVLTGLAAGTAVAAAALAGFSVFGGGPDTQSLLPGTQLPAAQAAELNQIADAAAAGPNAGPGKWLYLNVVTALHQGLQVGASPVLYYSVNEDVQIWSASASGPTRMRATFSNLSFASPHLRDPVVTRERAALKRLKVADSVFPRGEAVSPTDIGNGTASKVPLSSLPSQPEALVAKLGREHLKSFGHGSALLSATQRKQQRPFITDNQALSEWIGLSQILIASTSARQRAAAYRALTLVPFVRVVGLRRDSHGRPGTEVTFHIPAPGSPTRRMIVDPHTGDLLQNSTGSGSVTVWLTRAVVSGDTDLPAGGKQPLTHARRHPFPLLGFLGSGLLG